jgi:hypothetical protein
LIANRERDIEDSAALAIAGLDYEAVLGEIEAQYGRAGKVEEKIWITYIEEGIGRLEEQYGLQIPIGDWISEMADEYRERLYRSLKA